MSDVIKRRWRAALLITALIAGVFGVLWSGGAVYFAINKINPMKAGLWTWWDCFHAYPADQVRLWLSLGGGAMPVLALLATIVMMVFQEHRSLHGDARFATVGEVRRAGLLSDQGIIVGRHHGRMLRFPGQQFVMLAAPTRSGKGVGVVIPNCLDWQQSMVVLDIKQENFNLTAGYRERVLKQAVYLFNPFAGETDAEGRAAPRTHRYNPLSSITEGLFRVGDILAIGHSIWPAGGKDAFWNDSARNLFLGLVLFLCELHDRRAKPAAGEGGQDLPLYPVSLGEVLRQASGRGSGLPVKKYIGGLLQSYPWLSSECQDALSNFLSASDDVLSSILSTFNAPLTVFRNPIVDAATSENDFDLRDVRKRPMSVYIGITPDRMPDARLIVNLLFAQLVNLNTKQLPQDNHEGPGGTSILKFACLLLMDEFTAIGKIEILAKAVSYIAGYNLRLLPIIQAPSQLLAPTSYGQEDARTFMTNHAMQILFAPREQKDAQEYSEMLGYTGQRSQSVSRPKNFFGPGKASGMSESVSEQRRALMLPQELRELGQQQEIILLENTKPILAEKIRYYADPIFKARLLPPPVVKPMNMDLFKARSQGRMRSLREDEIGSGAQGVKDPPGVEMLLAFEQCPTFAGHVEIDANGAMELAMSLATADGLDPEILDRVRRAQNFEAELPVGGGNALEPVVDLAGQNLSDAEVDSAFVRI